MKGEKMASAKLQIIQGCGSSKDMLINSHETKFWIKLHHKYIRQKKYSAATLMMTLLRMPF